MIDRIGIRPGGISTPVENQFEEVPSLALKHEGSILAPWTTNAARKERLSALSVMVEPNGIEPSTS